MPEGDSTPSAKGLGAKLKEIPVWVWLAGAAGIGILYYYNSKVVPPPAATPATGTVDPNASGLQDSNLAGMPYDYYNPPPLYGGTPTPTPTPSPIPPVPAPTPTPGTTFVNPSSGVDHYVSMGTESLSQIATKLGLPSWNTMYAIPENQQQFNGGHPMDAQAAAAYDPPADMNVVVPSGTQYPKNSGGPNIGSTGEGTLPDEWGSMQSDYNLDTTSFAQYLYSTPGIMK